MRQRAKRLSASEQLSLLEASGADYVILGAASAVPLFLSGQAIQKPNIGLFFAGVCSVGLLLSFLIRRVLPKGRYLQHTGWLQLGVALIVLFNILRLNAMLPDGGFDIKLLVPAYLCWFMCVGSFFLWTDGAMMFMTVPGVALFGILSWLETGGYFEVSLILFMASVAVLLTRLHRRMMFASALAAGANDIGELMAGPWKAMAGPILAIVSVLVVAAFSWFVSPTIGSTVRTIVGSPQIAWTPPMPASGRLAGLRVDQTIGNGPATSSDLPLLKVWTNRPPPYIRLKSFDVYRGRGWAEFGNARQVRPSESPPESDVKNAVVYDFPARRPLTKGREVQMIVQSVSQSHVYAPVSGSPLRFEYDGSISLDRGQFIVLNDGLPSGKSFYARTQWHEPGPDDLRGATQSRSRNPATQLSSDVVDSRVTRLARSIAVGKETDYDSIIAFLNYIAENCRYNLNAEGISGDEDRVAAFLFETKEGYCDLFASALAVMCRSVGISARVAVGYRLDPESKEDGAIIVRDRHAHMWTEVFFQEYGWIPFDVTDFAEAVPGGEVGALKGDDEGNVTLRWAATAAGIVFGGVFVALVGAAIYSTLRTRRTLRGPLRRLRPSYMAFMRLLAKRLKRPKAPSETVSEYAKAYAEASANGNGALTVAKAFEEAFYGVDEPSEEQIRGIQQGVRELVLSSKGQNGR